MPMVKVATPSRVQDYTVSLKVLIDKEKKKVVFAEAGKDFVDVLLSFLTLPLGTIVRLVSKESDIQAVKVGSLSTLYESVSHLEEKFLWIEECKQMLLQPKNSMENYCQTLRLNIDDTKPKGIRCEIWPGCHCAGKSDERGFVKECASFLVCDDLYIMPNAFGVSTNLFLDLGIEDIEILEEQIVDITKKEVVDLLKFSLISRTPMTDLILRKKQHFDNFTPINQKMLEIGKVPSSEGKPMVVKLHIRKSNGKILFAEAEEEFVDFILSFLSFPLGGVLHMLEEFSSVSCIDRLYKSLNELSSEKYLMSHELGDKLASPPCDAHYNLMISNHILPFGVEYLCYYIKSSSPPGFVKGPGMYMVTDDLVVTPMSSIYAVTCLKTLKVPLFDLEERVIAIGVKEGLGILKASLTSTFALTEGLKHLIRPIE